MSNLANQQKIAENALATLEKEFGTMAEVVQMVKLWEGGFVPTIRNAETAAAIKYMGFRCWNSKTGHNW